MEQNMPCVFPFQRLRAAQCADDRIVHGHTKYLVAFPAEKVIGKERFGHMPGRFANRARRIPILGSTRVRFFDGF
jgi:hypothetical protein